MSKIDIGGYILGHQLGQEAGKKDAHPKEYERHAADEIERTCLSLDPVAEAECVVCVINTAHEHKRAESDLIAQRNMARWAFWMLLATVAMAIITAFGVYCVWRTLKATQDMARDTREIGQAQVNAAKDQAALAKMELEAARSASRPYLAVEVEDTNIWSVYKDGGKAFFDVSLRNVGVVPIRVKSGWIKIDVDGSPSFPIHENARDTQEVYRPLGPDSEGCDILINSAIIEVDKSITRRLVDLSDINPSLEGAPTDYISFVARMRGGFQAAVSNGLSDEQPIWVWCFGTIYYQRFSGETFKHQFCFRGWPYDRKIEVAPDHHNYDKQVS